MSNYISRRASANSVEKSAFSFIRISKAQPSAIECDHDYKIVIITEGECTVAFSDCKKSFFAYSLLVCAPNKKCIISSDRSCKLFVLTATVEQLQNALKLYGLTYEYFFGLILEERCDLIINDSSVISKKISQLSEHNEFGNNAFGTVNLISEVVFLLVNSNSSSSLNFPQWFSSLLLEMSKPENFKNGLARIKEISNYSQEYLSRCFKSYLNVTPTEYINNLRLEYAAKLLTENDSNILDICFESGFNSEGHFYYLFRKRYHITPAKYRSRYKKDKEG